jgi:hypothetical protein
MTSFAIAARPIPAILNTAHLFSSAIAPIQKQLVGFLDPVDFLAFSAVSKEVRCSLQNGLTSPIHNVNGKLKTFFDEPTAFRRVQAKAGALIGGNFARSFIGNSSELVNVLDIYVECN